ncbi:MAG: hypothetical protein WAV13_03975 [Thermodesulfovibrionales bacterium]
MLSMLIAVAVALAPEKPLGPGDDWNEVIAANEAQLHCEAVRLYRSEPDSMRVVVFRCQAGETLVPFVYRGEQGWFPIDRVWTWAPEKKTDGSEI